MKNENQTSAVFGSPAVKALISGLTALIFMLYTVFSSTIYAVITILLFLFYAYKISDKKINFVLISTFTAIAFFALGTSTEALAYFISIISATVIGGIMLLNKKSGICFIAFAVAAYALAAFLSSPSEALTVFVALPPAIVLAVSAKLKASRTASICAVSGIFIATLLVPFAITMRIQYGDEALNTFRTFIDEFKTTFTEAIVSLVQETFADNSSIAESLDKQTVSVLVDTVISLVPAILIIFSNIVAFSAHTLSMIVRETLGVSLTEAESSLSLSKTSALLYIVSFFVSLFSSSASGTARVLTVAMQNVNLILTLSFFVVGITAAAALIRSDGRRKGVMNKIILILAVLYCGTFLIYPIAAFGVIKTLQNRKRSQQS